MVEGQIRISGELHTRLELVCARCLEPVIEEVSRDFDLFYRPMQSMTQEEEFRLKLDDTEIAFFEGEGLFLADVLAEQVLLAIPMKVICRSDCRGLCPHCGANLNTDECRCEAHAADTRLAPLGASQAGLVQKAIAIDLENTIEFPRRERDSIEESVCPIQNDVIPRGARINGARTTI